VEKFVTPSGLEFRGESWVTVCGEDYPLNALTREQRSLVATCVDLQGLNEAFAGRMEFSAPGLLDLADALQGLGEETGGSPKKAEKTPP
jgi:hypothetical protein